MYPFEACLATSRKMSRLSGVLCESRPHALPTISARRLGPPTFEDILADVPAAMAADFPGTIRAVDASDIPTQRPTMNKSHYYSVHHRQHCTKFLELNLFLNCLPLFNRITLIRSG